VNRCNLRLRLPGTEAADAFAAVGKGYPRLRLLGTEAA
jgi:hypothetical protein